MGNEQPSQIMTVNPSISLILKSLHLQTQQQDHTHSLVHSYFALQFTRTQKAIFDRSMNPFCPLSLITSGNWLTTCLVNPMMAIVSPLYIIDNHGEFHTNCQILPAYKHFQHCISIKHVIILPQQQNICLIILQNPYWKVGWAGISYIKDLRQLQVLQMKIVYHPGKIINKQNGKLFHQQLVSRFKISKLAKISQEFTVPNQGIIGALICKISKNKPYIIGIQISQLQVMFFNDKTYKKIQESAKKYIKKDQKQILKQIDMKQFELQTQQ